MSHTVQAYEDENDDICTQSLKYSTSTLLCPSTIWMINIICSTVHIQVFLTLRIDEMIDKSGTLPSLNSESLNRVDVFERC